ncbi:AAA family ATPase [Chryseomicrobium palamuruense]|uniref:AAA family ATPase n=1 Tax=Chryseomicrobium palamuruense TaxID=682973 RepID=A0ABV8UQJ2_9BACL
MKILELYVYGFGQHRDQHFLFDERQAIIGPNESGKSTLYEALLQILFGFPTRANSKRMEPKNGGSFGGWARIEKEGTLYQVERVTGKSAGHVTVSRDGHVLGGEDTLSTILNGLTRSQVEAIFAFHVFDLQQLHQLSEEDLTELFFVSGTTGKNPYADIKKEAEKELQRLYRPGGRKPLINQQLDKLKKLERSLDQAASQEQLYSQLQHEEESLHKVIHTGRVKVRRLKDLLSSAEEQQVLLPYFEEYDELIQRTTPSYSLISEEQETLALAWEKERRELSARLEKVAQSSIDFQDTNQLKYDIQQLEDFLQKETQWREARAKISELEEQLEAIVREQQPILSSLQLPEDAVEKHLPSFDLSYQQEERLQKLMTKERMPTFSGPLLFFLAALVVTVIAILSEQWWGLFPALLFVGLGFLNQSSKKEVSSADIAIQQFFKPYHIQVSSTYRAETIFDSLRQLQKLEVAYRQIEERLYQFQEIIDRIHHEAKDIHVEELGQGEAFREVRSQLNAKYAQLKALQLANEESAHQNKKKQDWKEELDLLTHQLTSIFDELNISSVEEFYDRLTYSKQMRKDQERLKEIRLRIEGKERRDLSKSKIQIELDEAETELEDSIHALMTVKQKIEQVISNQERSMLLQTFEEEKAYYASLVTEYAAWKTLSERIEQMYAHYQQEVFPATLQRASDLFKRFTANAYTFLHYQEGSFYAVHSQGHRFKPEELSQATKEQAYLALRFALAEEMAKEKPFVLLMDDPFVHFDAVRFQQVVQWLLSEDNTLPFIYFSCHEEIMEAQPSISIVNLQAERSLYYERDHNTTRRRFS